MTMTCPETVPERARREKPAMGRPVLFALLLAVAAIGTLILLVAGPSLALPLAVASATALMCLVLATWVIAGPRL